MREPSAICKRSSGLWKSRPVVFDALGAVADRLGVHKELAGRFLVVKVVLAQDRGGLKELKAAVVELAHAGR